MRADMELFNILADQTMGGIRRTGTGTLPCDTIIELAMNHRRISQILTALPVGGGGRAGAMLQGWLCSQLGLVVSMQPVSFNSSHIRGRMGILISIVVAIAIAFAFVFLYL